MFSVQCVVPHVNAGAFAGDIVRFLVDFIPVFNWSVAPPLSAEHSAVNPDAQYEMRRRIILNHQIAVVVDAGGAASERHGSV